MKSERATGTNGKWQKIYYHWRTPSVAKAIWFIKQAILSPLGSTRLFTPILWLKCELNHHSAGTWGLGCCDRPSAPTSLLFRQPNNPAFSFSLHGLHRKRETQKIMHDAVFCRDTLGYKREEVGSEKEKSEPENERTCLPVSLHGF